MYNNQLGWLHTCMYITGCRPAWLAAYWLNHHILFILLHNQLCSELLRQPVVQKLASLALLNSLQQLEHLSVQSQKYLPAWYCMCIIICKLLYTNGQGTPLFYTVQSSFFKHLSFTSGLQVLYTRPGSATYDMHAWVWLHK